MSTTTTTITDPAQLVAEFKKSGEFDRLRRELLSQFKNNDLIGTFMSRVEDIIQQRLAEDERLEYVPPQAAHNELMQDMDRFPLVQRTVADHPALTDPSFSAALRRSLVKLLNDERGKNPDSGKVDKDGDVNMDESEDSNSESSDDNDDDEHEHSSGDEELVESTVPAENPRDHPRSSDDVKEHELSKMVNGASETTEAASKTSSPSTSQVNPSLPEQGG